MARVQQRVTMPTLFGGQVERVSSVVNDELVPIDNSSDAVYAVSSDGREWVRKTVECTGCQPLLAEAIGLLMGRELDAPVPPGAVTGHGNTASWLSHVIRPVVHWNPKRLHFVQNLDALGRLLTLDAVLLNEDRHSGNILLQPLGTATELRLWGIDMGNALVGHPQDFANAAIRPPQVRNLARGIPTDLVQEGAFVAAAAAQGLSQGLVQTLVREACGLALEPQHQMVSEALWERLQQAPKIVDEYLATIREMP